MEKSILNDLAGIGVRCQALLAFGKFSKIHLSPFHLENLENKFAT